jgi:hypothetical protein
MDIWIATEKRIKEVAERKSGLRAISVYKPSGLYAWVSMSNGHTITVYDREL